MEIPVFYECNNPEKMKNQKIGEVTSYNKDSHQVTIKIGEEYCDEVYGLISSDIPVSMSFKMKPAIPDKRRIK